METGDVGGATKAWCWSFGRCEFDESRWELRVAGEPVELERKPAEVLQYLLRHAGEVVTKAELLGSVWAGRVVVEAVLTNAVGKVRKALEGSGQEIVATLPKVGYRLVVPVSRRMVEYLPEDSRLQAGDAVPRRQNWKLEAPLARTEGNEVWLARHAKTREVRVFKFSLSGRGLHGLKREVTIARLLHEALGERGDFVRVLDWISTKRRISWNPSTVAWGWTAGPRAARCRACPCRCAWPCSWRPPMRWRPRTAWVCCTRT